MAIGWFTLLKSVPWTTVIGNAPVVADGARKLWKAVGNKPATATPPDDGAAVGAGDDVAALRGELAALQAVTSQLDAQMLASSELIKALAEQNAELIARVEALRVRALWTSVATLVLGIVVVALVVGAVRMAS